jgi:hypothetical protein
MRRTTTCDPERPVANIAAFAKERLIADLSDQVV